ncbi:hypothetical protein [Nonomuraea sp. NPDC049607]|uniref:hypothetical protein n=1 Tax=Nonomuraea sp. NPDC049607 TaxID=3154732 RepID=UPI003419B938
MDEDVARLPPLGDAHLNCPGRSALASSASAQGLRSLGSPRSSRGADEPAA